MKKMCFFIVAVIAFASPTVFSKDNSDTIDVWLKSQPTYIHNYFETEYVSLRTMLDLSDTARIIQDKTFNFLLKPFLTHSIVADKEVISMGTGFALTADNKEATVSATFSTLVAKKKEPKILSFGFKSVFDPDNSMVNIYKEGETQFGFGGNCRFAWLGWGNSVFYNNNISETHGKNLKKITTVRKNMSQQENMLLHYIKVYRHLDSLRISIVENIRNRDFDSDSMINTGILNRDTSIQSYIDSFRILPSVSIRTLSDVLLKITDTMQKMKENTKDFYELAVEDSMRAGKYAEQKIVEYEVENINSLTHGFTTNFWDFNIAFDRKKYAVLDLTMIPANSNTLKNIQSDQVGNRVSFEFNYHRMHLGPKSLRYFNGAIKAALSHTFATLSDAEQATVHSVKLLAPVDSVIGNNTAIYSDKDFKGYDKASYIFSYMPIFDIRLYTMGYFGEKRIAGVEGTVSTSIRPTIKNIKGDALDREIAKMDLSAGFLLSIPSKDKENKTKSVNLAFLLNFNDIFNSDKTYTTPTKTDDGFKEKMKNRFGFGVRIGVPINKIIY